MGNFPFSLLCVSQSVYCRPGGYRIGDALPSLVNMNEPDHWNVEVLGGPILLALGWLCSPSCYMKLPGFGTVTKKYKKNTKHEAGNTSYSACLEFIVLGTVRSTFDY